HHEVPVGTERERGGRVTVLALLTVHIPSPSHGTVAACDPGDEERREAVVVQRACGENIVVRRRLEISDEVQALAPMCTEATAPAYASISVELHERGSSSRSEERRVGKEWS